MTLNVRFDALRGERPALNLYIQFVIVRLLTIIALILYTRIALVFILLFLPTTVLGILLQKSTRLALRFEMVGGFVAAALIGLSVIFTDSESAAWLDVWFLSLGLVAIWAALMWWEIRLYGRVLSVLSESRT
jgi:hypothetical protein